MSILPLNAATLCLGLFEQTLTVADYSYITENGIDKKQLYGSRVSIKAAVDASGNQQLIRIFGGAVSDGDIGIYTKEILYILDEFTNLTDRKNTIITYSGLLYSIKQKADWSEQAGAYVYLAGRYVDQGR